AAAVQRSDEALPFTVARNAPELPALLSLDFSDPWRRKFVVTLEGEKGFDTGGVTREWLQLMLRLLFDPAYGVVEPLHDGAAEIFFSRHAQEAVGDLPTQLGLLGRLVGKSIQLGQPLATALPRGLYAVMAGRDVDLEMLATSDPQAARSLQQILDMDDATDVGLDFTADEKTLGSGASTPIPLVPGGDRIEVTNDNRAAYVHSLVQYKLVHRPADALAHFLTGLYDIVDPEALGQFSAAELQRIVGGESHVDVAKWRAATDVKPAAKEDGSTMRAFWRVIEGDGGAPGLSEDDKRKLLYHFTGVKGLQAGPIERRFTINVQGETRHLPVGHGCSSTLDLPDYGSEALMRERLTALLAHVEDIALDLV
ncbi:MAG TPA: hypothetical protein VFH51_19615, partial [Myxococcota bacterium]|nr:hypothetical protein [Myxococcota bacterium]